MRGAEKKAPIQDCIPALLLKPPLRDIGEVLMPTKIEWTQETWNPVSGCDPVSEGCRNCYAERMARRLAGRCGYPEAPNHFNITLHPDRLDNPLRWKKPRLIFACSMGDLFHPDVSFKLIGRVFATAIAADWHTAFQILTKRPERMHSFVTWFQTKTALNLCSFRHIWLGVTTENQRCADERIPVLLRIPAAVRFVSVEPMLGAMDLALYLTKLQWVICGGETGPKARPMKPEWARSLRDQCSAAGVPFFMKQVSGRETIPDDLKVREFPSPLPNASQSWTL